MKRILFLTSLISLQLAFSQEASHCSVANCQACTPEGLCLTCEIGFDLKINKLDSTVDCLPTQRILQATTCNLPSCFTCVILTFCSYCGFQSIDTLTGNEQCTWPRPSPVGNCLIYSSTACVGCENGYTLSSNGN
jgi:hypothetical protein